MIIITDLISVIVLSTTFSINLAGGVVPENPRLCSWERNTSTAISVSFGQVEQFSFCVQAYPGLYYLARLDDVLIKNGTFNQNFMWSFKEVRERDCYLVYVKIRKIKSHNLEKHRIKVFTSLGVPHGMDYFFILEGSKSNAQFISILAVVVLDVVAVEVAVVFCVLVYRYREKLFMAPRITKLASAENTEKSEEQAKLFV